MFDRITFDPRILGGRACIRGLRIPVAVLVSQIAHGATVEEVLAGYPDLEREDIQQALAYAAWLAGSAGPTIRARFTRGVFEPLDPAGRTVVPEGEEVRLTVAPSAGDGDALRETAGAWKDLVDPDRLTERHRPRWP